MELLQIFPTFVAQFRVDSATMQIADFSEEIADGENAAFALFPCVSPLSSLVWTPWNLESETQTDTTHEQHKAQSKHSSKWPRKTVENDISLQRDQNNAESGGKCPGAKF